MSPLFCTNMVNRFRHTLAEYPPQFWLITSGVLISSAGGSMIWPFLMIYTSEKLNLSLSTVSTLITINAGTGILASFIAGAVADRLGRKPVMVISLVVNGVGYLFMSQAQTYLGFAILQFIMGASNPLYQVGADAMLADLIVPEKRTNAYAIVRMINNAGIAIGPAAGGFVASRSYTYAFIGAASGMFIYGLLLFFRGRETLSRTFPIDKRPVVEGMGGYLYVLREHLYSNFALLVGSGRLTIRAMVQTLLKGYTRVFHDRPFITFTILIGTGMTAPAMLWSLLAVYTKQNFSLPENLFGWLPTTNALMCVFVQLFVTRISKRYKALPVAAVGMLTYAIGVGSVALMKSFWGFWTSMIVVTFGELILIPTVSKYIADLAPLDMRGRYMSFYWLAWGIARATAPLAGGFLNDNISPRYIWIGGLTIGLASTIGLTIFDRFQKAGSIPKAHDNQIMR